LVGEQTAYIYDQEKLKQDFEALMATLNMVSNLVFMILFILVFFQLVISISSNIRDDAWELGVLR
jgi:uncharacterized membrane protein